MNKIDEARQILKWLEVTDKQQGNLCCYVLLAMAGLAENSNWSAATNEWIRIHDIIR